LSGFVAVTAMSKFSRASFSAIVAPTP